MSLFDSLALLCILLVTFAGGYAPLFGKSMGAVRSYPGAEAFTAGIFLALSLVIMLPAATGLLGSAWDTGYPIASVISVLFFFVLLSIEHAVEHLRLRTNDSSTLNAPAISIIMTFMIAVPSFFMGTALGVSNKSLEWFIFIAIMAHKSSAGFALALEMVKSRLTPKQRLLLFACFALSTPIGLVLGSTLHGYLGGYTMQVAKGLVLSMASGTFLYLGTLHELKHAPLIAHCNCRRNFLLLLAGFILTAIVRLLLGAAHQG
jgi:zinc transporter ZupT